MPQKTIFIFGLLIFLSSGILFAQEEAVSLNTSNMDSLAVAMNDSNGTDLLSLTSDGLYFDIPSDYLNLIYAFIFFILAFVVIMYLRQPLEHLADRQTKSSVIRQIIPLFLIICWFIIIYVIIDILKLSGLSSSLIFIITGLAVAIALRDPLEEVIFGIILPFEGHIQKGFKIRTHEVFGEVTKIRLRGIEIKKSNGSIAIIPSSIILKNTIIELYPEEENCPVCVNIYLPVESKFDALREIAHRSAIISTYLYLKKPVTVTFLNEFLDGQSIITMQIKAYLLKIEYHSVFTSELTESILKEINSADFITGSNQPD
jgi:small-conductance mechanosensitive channel